MKKIDIKYLGIPNICFSLTDKEDKREKIFKKQRIERGFDESETWCLTTTIANFIIPRLKLFREINNKKTIRDKKFYREIDDIIIAMELIVRNNGARIFTEKEEKQVDKGLKILPKIFLLLWW